MPFHTRKEYYDKCQREMLAEINALIVENEKIINGNNALLTSMREYTPMTRPETRIDYSNEETS